MAKVTLHIENSYERREIELDDEITIGRTDASGLVLSDPGLSRRNTTVFRDGETIVAVDEGSLKGTFLNENRLTEATEVRNGDELKIGTETRIRIAIGEARVQQSAVRGQPSASSRTDAPIAAPTLSTTGPRSAAPKQHSTAPQ